MKKMTRFKRTIQLIILFFFISFFNSILAQYQVDFEGAAETKPNYAVGVVNLSGLSWELGPEVLIGEETNDYKLGLRSARLRGRDGAKMEMTQDKVNGMGVVSFVYRSYGADNLQESWLVEYSVDGGVVWTQIGTPIMATVTPQNFNQTVNVAGNVRLRIKIATTPGNLGNKRLNIDNILITNFTSGTPVLIANNTNISGLTYIIGNGPSSNQTISVTGQNLTGSGNVTVTAPSGFQVSTNGTTFSSSINLPYSSGVITGTGQFYVRLVAGLNPGAYSGSITVVGGGASLISINASGTVSATLYPAVHNLLSGSYMFTDWSDASGAFTYPSNMRFWAASSDQPTVSDIATGNYFGAYNLTSGSRINGLNENGISFVTTAVEGSGFPLGAVLGISSLGKENIQVKWTGGLVTQGTGTPNPRSYGLRLQYQIGQSSTWTDVVGPVEYLSAGKTNGHSQDFPPVTLPASCNNQSEIYLRWVYYHIAANDGGTRPVIRLDEIVVDGTDLNSLYPELHSLSTSPFSFTQWSNTSTAGTYPLSMRFWKAASDQVALNELPVDKYTGVYNLTTGSRINGLNTNGVSFVTTATEGAGFPLGAVVGLNTLGQDNINVSWVGGLVAQGNGSPTPRHYGLRLQYQVGQGSVWTDVAGPVEYLTMNQINGHEQVFGPTILPTACNNQPEVYLRWVYYFVNQNSGGTRPSIRLDEISVTSSTLSTLPQISASSSSLSGFNQVIGNVSSSQTFTVQGSNLSSGIVLTTTSGYEISLTSGTGYSTNLNLPQSSGTVSPTTIYVRLNSGFVGVHPGSITISSVGAVDRVVVLNGQTVNEQEELLYYWHFNNLVETTNELEVISDYSYLSSIDGKLSFTNPQLGQNNVVRNETGSSLNLMLSAIDGYSVRFENPTSTREMLFDVPTTGAERIGFKFAVQRNDVGMTHNIVQYSLDGVNFYSAGLINNTVEVIGVDNWQLFVYDFSSIVGVNNNPNFKIKIIWSGNNTSVVGSNSYDNISVTAQEIAADLSINKLEESIVSIFPVPFKEIITITSSEQIKEINIVDLLGKIVKTETGNHSLSQQIETIDLKSGVYFFLIDTEKGIQKVKAIKE